MFAVNADGQVQPPSGGPTEEILECKFCLSEYGSDPVEGLLCGHVFHTACIHRWMEISHKPKAKCCPYKCLLTSVQIPVHVDTQMMDDGNDQQAQRGDNELRLASAIQ